MRPPRFHELLRSKINSSPFSQEQVAARLGCSNATVSRWVNAHSSPHLGTVEEIDKLLKTGTELVDAWKLSKATKVRTEWAETLVQLEEEAVYVQVASPALVPGYLQSPLYAASVFRAWSPSASDNEIEELSRIRVGQLAQMPSLRRATAVFPLMGITAFDDEVRKDQAQHLLTLGEAGRVRIHLVPEGSLLLSVTSPVLLFHLLDGELVMSSDHLDGNVIYDPDRTAALAPLIAEATAEALPARHSLEVLKGLV